MTNSENLFCVKTFYKSLAKKENFSESLKDFVSRAEEYISDQSKQDVVKEYIKFSGGCEELKELTKILSNSSAKDGLILLKALTCILARIASDLNVYSALGNSLVTEILNNGVKSMCRFVKLGQKSAKVKCALNLFASMVAQGPQAASSVFSKINLSGPYFSHLLNKSNPWQEEDIRASYMNVVLLLFVFGDNSLIRRIMELKGFLNSMFPGLPSDRPSMIMFFLETLYAKVINNSAISKTMKIRVFNDFTLKYVTQLYAWHGPKVRHKGVKRKLESDGEPQFLSADEADIKAVQEMAHKFMKSLCCSFKTGIIFHDSAYGSSGKNPNHILTNILTSFPNPYSNELMSELLIEVMKTCPDQIKYFLPSMKDSVVPRLSEPWMQAINFVKQVVKSQDYVRCFFKAGEKKPVSKMIAVAKTISVPPLITSNDIVNCLKESPRSVVHELLQYITVILEQVKSVLDFCDSIEGKAILAESESKEFCKSFADFIKSTLPDVKYFQNYWFQITSGNAHAKAQDDDTCQDISKRTYFECLCQVLETLKLFSYLHQTSSGNVDATFYYLFCGLKSCTSHLSKEEICCLHLKLIDIFSCKDFIQTSQWSDSLGKPPLAFVIDLFLMVEDPDIASQVLKLIYQLLKSLPKFKGELREVEIWMKLLKMFSEEHQTLLKDFLNEVMSNLGDDSEETTEIVGQENCSTFSNMIPAALKIISFQNENNEEKFDICRCYFETCLKLIMNYQKEPKKLYNTLKKHKSLFDIQLFSYWKLLCHLGKHEVEKSGIVKYKEHVKLENYESLQEAFLLFHQHDMQHQFKKCFKKLKKNFRDLNQDNITWLLWQLLLYINVEADMILVDSTFQTAIPFYIELLETFILKSDESSKTETIVDEEAKEIINVPSSNLSENILKDISCHPAVLKCFFMISNSKEEENSCNEAMTNFIFSILQSNKVFTESNKFFDVLLPLKNKAVQFCKNNIGSCLKEDEKKCKLSAFKNVIEVFSSLFDSSDKKTLLQCILSVDEILLSELDPKGSMFFTLLEICIQEKKYSLLPPEVVKDLFSRFVLMKKSKQKNNMRESIWKIIEKHPIYALSIDEGSVLTLMKQESNSTLKIFEVLIRNSDSIHSSIKQEISSVSINLDEHDLDFFMHLIVYCFDVGRKNEKDFEFLRAMSSFIWKYLKSMIEHAESHLKYPIHNVSHIMSLLQENKIFSEKKIKKLMEKLRAKSEESIPHPSRALFLVNLICSCKGCSFVTSVKPCLTLMQILLNWISMITKNVSIDELPKLQPLLNLYSSSFQNVETTILEELFTDDSIWLSHVQQILKIALRCAVGKDLLSALNITCKKLYSPDSSKHLKKSDVKNIHDLLISHSNFFSIMLNETDELGQLKETVIDFLITLTDLDNICQDSHIPLLLASYTATFTPSDQKLLYLLKLYEDRNVDMSRFSPFLWGKPAISHYSVHKNLKLFLWKQPRMQDILGLFQPDVLNYSAVNFPLHLKLEPSLEIATFTPISSQEMMKLNGMYDPRFVLPLLCVVLSPGSFVNSKFFIDSKVVGIVFASLSSSNSQMRAVGYYCLSQFFSHLVGSMHGQHKIWVSLFETIRNSIRTPNQKIPSIISVFLTRAVEVLSQPGNQLYVSLYKFLTLKPILALDQVPDFYVFFNSTEIEHRVQRRWILSLLEDGIRGSLDFHLCQKRHLFTILLPYYSSSICEENEKVQILKILEAAVCTYSSARTLFQTGLLSWLHSTVITSNDIIVLRGIVDIVCTLWKTSLSSEPTEISSISKQKVESTDVSTTDIELDGDAQNDALQAKPSQETSVEKRRFHSSFVDEFLLVCFEMLKKIELMDSKTLHKYLQVLSNVLEHVDINSPTEETHRTNPNLSISQVLCIIRKWTMICSHSGSEHISSEGSGSNKSSVHLIEKTVHELFGKVVMQWCPELSVHEGYYRNVIELCVDVTYLVLKNCQYKYKLLQRCSEWLISCLENDLRKGLVKLFLMSDGKNSLPCLELILLQWEMNLKNACHRPEKDPLKWDNIIYFLINNKQKATPHVTDILDSLCSLRK